MKPNLHSQAFFLFLFVSLSSLCEISTQVMNNNNPDSSDSSKETSFQGLCPPPSTTTNVARDVNETHSQHPSVNIARGPADDNEARRPPPVAGDLDESCPRPPPPPNVPAVAATANETRPHPRPNLNVPTAANETHPRPNLNVPGASETHEKPKKKQKRAREIIVGGEMTTLRLGCDSNMQVGSTSKKPKPKPKIPDLNAPQIECPCVATCSKSFVNVKALFGHMRCHSDRGWRGIVPPEERRRRRKLKLEQLKQLKLKQLKPVTASADPQGSGLGRVDINQDDQDVANGLLMLANGLLSMDDDHRYACSSCKRVFGSHQALGGHRASHKKVKGCFAITAKNSDDSNINENRNNEDDSNGSNGDGSSDPKGKGKAKVTDEQQGIVSGDHRCGICAKNFASGQALGGHMRCHWDRFDQNSSSSSMMMFQPQQQLGGILFNPSTTTAGCSTSYANRGEWDGSSTCFALDLNVPPPTGPAEPEPEPAPVPDDAANGTENSSSSSTSSSEMDLDLKLGF